MPVNVFHIVLVACVAARGWGELFSSIAHLQSALYAERDIAREIRQYVQEQQERLQKMTELAEDFEQHSSMALQDPDYYLGNPVNAFLFVKHFTLDWDRDVDTLLSNTSVTDLSKKIEGLRQNLPTYEDLQGSVSALLRLQDTYKLDTTELAQGNVGGVTSSELSAWDCFELGRLAYNEEDFYHTIMWMEEAINRVKAGDDDEVNVISILDYLAFALYKIGRQSYTRGDYYHTILWMQESYDRAVFEKVGIESTTTILDYLQFSLYKQGNVKRALRLTNEMLEIAPDHSRAQSNKMYYEKVLNVDDVGSQKRGDDGEIVNRRQLDEYRSGEEYSAYEALCRGENIRANKDAHKLTCRYRSNGHPLLLLSPAKEEILYLKPFIAQYHNSITDNEIEMIKILATPKLGRATVHNPQTGKLESAAYRVSKSCWLSGYDSPNIERINNRISAITGLTMDTAEELQIANYGIGGQYEPHFDFARKREPTAFEKEVGNRIATFMFYKEENAFKSLNTGNRIATLMFYISDVQAGGATVFPYLGLKIFPQKGTAVFWYNLFKNGEGIYDTRHAACPVLVGSKWVTNKWIHERGQEFLRPCGLVEEE